MDYPNNLTILINTRIRGYPKIKYEPSMSIPGEKSTSVFFDPLIKLNGRVITSPEEFFNKGEFESLLSRTISSSFLGQSRIDYDTAKKKGYITNNIKVTLNKIFKPNSRLYIKGRPFTIGGYEWLENDWRVDTKSFEKDFQRLQNNYGNRYGNRYGNNWMRYNITKTEEEQAEKELEAFIKKHPDSFKGEVNEKESQFADYYQGEGEGLMNDVGMGLSNQPTIPLTSASPIPSSSKKEIDKYVLAANMVMNESIQSEPNMQSDPLTLTLIYSKDRNYSNEIKKYPQLRQPYDILSNKKQELDAIKKSYNQAFGISQPEQEEDKGKEKEKSLLYWKEKYDTIAKDIQRDIRDNSPNKKTALDSLLNIKKEYLKKNAEVLQIFDRKMDIQDQYIRAFINFYKELSNAKEHERMLLTNTSTSTNTKKDIDIFILNIIIDLIRFDIQTYQSLLDNKNYIDLRRNTKNDTKIQLQQLNSSINSYYNITEEFEKYYNNPSLFDIEKYQYDVYYLQMIQNTQKNEEIVWNTFSSETTEYFRDTIQKTTLKSIEDTFQIFKKYNETYDSAERAAFIHKMEIGDTPIQNQSLTQYVSFNKEQKKYQKQKQDFMELRKLQEISYEWITIYARISAIQLGRQFSHLDLQNAVSKTGLQIYFAMNRYYMTILKHIPNINGLLPVSMYWSIRDYDNTQIVEEAMATNKEMGKYNQQQLAYIEDKMNQMEKEYTNAFDLLVPHISEMGVLKSCYKITEPMIYKEEGEGEDNDNEEKKRDYLSFLEKNEDKVFTKETASQLMLLISEQIQHGSSPEISVANISSIISQWKVISHPLNTDIIAEAFNGQMVLNQPTTMTLNRYARRPNNELNELPIKDIKRFKFTEKQMRTAVADNMTKEDGLLYVNQAEKMIDEELIHFAMLENVSDDCKMYVAKKIYKKWKKIAFIFKKTFNETIHFLENIKKDDYDTIYSALILNIDQPSTMDMLKERVLKNTTIYYEDEICLKIIERVFKIKVIVIDTDQSPLTIQDYAGKSIVYNRKPGKEDVGIIQSMKIPKDGSEYMRDKSTEFLKMMMDYQIYYFNRIKNVVKKTRNLRKIIDELIFLLSIQNVPLYPRASYMLLNLFIMKKGRSIPDESVLDYLQNPDLFDEYMRNNQDLTWDASDKLVEQRLRLPNVLPYLLEQIQDVIETIKKDYLPTYLVETNTNIEYELQADRIVRLSLPFFNISKEVDLNNTTADMGYLFLIRDHLTDTYKYLFNSSDKTFLYTFDRIPDYISYFMFRSVRKNNPFPSKSGAFKKLFDTYQQQQQKNENIRVVRLSPVNILEENIRGGGIINSSRVSNGGVFMPNGVEIDSGSGGGGRVSNGIINGRRVSNGRVSNGGVFMPNGVEIDSGNVSSIGGKTNLNQIYSNSNKNKDSKLSFYVIINLDLYPGKENITIGRKMVMGCQNRYEKIRQSWAKLFNLVYRPSEYYSLPPESHKKKDKKDTNKYSNQVTNNYINNNYYTGTRKNTDNNNNTKTRKNI